jgi:hypothetical protein
LVLRRKVEGHQVDASGLPEGGGEELSAARRLFQRAEAVYVEVEGLTGLERDRAVQRLCAGDRALESMVRGLLGSAGQVGGFLEQPALGRGLGDVVREAPDELIGSTVGAFRIERRIASGGMGTVYQAVRSDGQFEQTVGNEGCEAGDGHGGDPGAVPGRAADAGGAG